MQNTLTGLQKVDKTNSNRYCLMKGALSGEPLQSEKNYVHIYHKMCSDLERKTIGNPQPKNVNVSSLENKPKRRKIQLKLPSSGSRTIPMQNTTAWQRFKVSRKQVSCLWDLTNGQKSQGRRT